MPNHIVVYKKSPSNVNEVVKAIDDAVNSYCELHYALYLRYSKSLKNAMECLFVYQNSGCDLDVMAFSQCLKTFLTSNTATGDKSLKTLFVKNYLAKLGIDLEDFKKQILQLEIKNNFNRPGFRDDPVQIFCDEFASKGPLFIPEVISQGTLSIDKLKTVRHKQT